MGISRWMFDFHFGTTDVLNDQKQLEVLYMYLGRYVPSIHLGG